MAIRCEKCGARGAYQWRDGYYCEDCVDAMIEADPRYQAELAAAVQEAFATANQETMNVEQSQDRNRQIFDEAFAEDDILAQLRQLSDEALS